MDTKYLAANVRRLRKEKGLTMAQLSLLSGSTAIAMIESGHRGDHISYETATAIAKALGVAPESLFIRPRKRCA